MNVYPIPLGEGIELAYEGKAWVVVCGDTAYGPFNDVEHSVASLWLELHCPLGEPEDDGIRRNRCSAGHLWLNHRILSLWGWR